MTSPTPLADRFPRFTEADWQAVVADTRRRPIQIPVSDSDAIPVGPVYGRHADAHAVAGRPPGQPWMIVQRLDGGDVTEAARQARAAIAGGANGIAAVFKTSAHPLPGALTVDAASDLAIGLGKALPDGCLVSIDAGAATPAVSAPFVELAERKRWRLVFAFDPIATQAGNDGAAAIVAAAGSFDARAIDGSVAIADGRLWHAGGASEAQELAATLATVVELLRLFEAGGLPLDRAAARLGVALAADADQFLTIAKFRAARLLVGRIFEVAGIAAPAPHVHAETAWRTMRRDDPHSNIARATVATFAAAVGGADSISVLPFDAAAGGGDGLARRLARNTQTILAEEAHVYRVADPAAGSGAGEALTAALADAAWRRFQGIEAEGGIQAALASGSLRRPAAGQQ